MKKHHFSVFVALLAVGALGACQRDTAPAPGEPETGGNAVTAAPEPSPAEGFTTDAPAAAATNVAPAAPRPGVVLSPNIPGSEDRRLRKAIAEVSAAALGGPLQDATREEAYDRAFKALYSFLAQQRIPTESFYLKDKPDNSAYRTFMFFGEKAPGEGLYVYVRIFPDGRAEITD